MEEFEKPQGFKPLSKNKREESFVAPKEDIVEIEKSVVVVDTFSTGAMLAHNLYSRGYKVRC